MRFWNVRSTNVLPLSHSKSDWCICYMHTVNMSWRWRLCAMYTVYFVSQSIYYCSALTAANGNSNIVDDDSNNNNKQQHTVDQNQMHECLDSRRSNEQCGNVLVCVRERNVSMHDEPHATVLHVYAFNVTKLNPVVCFCWHLNVFVLNIVCACYSKRDCV